MLEITSGHWDIGGKTEISRGHWGMEERQRSVESTGLWRNGTDQQTSLGYWSYGRDQ